MEKLSRRKFAGLSVLGVVATFISTSAFGCADIFARVSAYVGVGVQAVSSVVALLAGQGIITLPEGTLISAVLTTIKTAWADVTAAVSAYEGAAPDQKATLAGRISLALTVVANSIQTFWSDLKIPDAKLAQTVAGLLGLVVSTIAGFLAALPPAPSAPSVKLARPLTKMLAVKPKRLTPKEFKKEFNAILSSSGYSERIS